MKKFISSLFLLSALLLMGANEIHAQWVNTCLGPNPGAGLVGGHESTTNNDKIYVRSETFAQDSVRTISYSIIVNGVAQAQTIIINPPVAPANYHFLHWIVADYANPMLTDTTTCNNATWEGRDRIYTAVFEPDIMTITVRSADPTQAASTDSVKYVPFDGSVRISVTPNPGYVFDHWNDGDTTNPRMLTHVNGNNTYTAYYVRDSFSISTAVLPRNGLIDGNVSGAGRYVYLDTAVITATPTTPNYRFKQWNDGDTTNPRYVVVLGNALYTAEFTHDTIDVQESACFSNGTYTWEGLTIDLTGVTSDTSTIVRTKSFRSAVSGIANDSVRRLTLTVYKDIVYNEVQDTGVACNGYTWRGTTYTLSGAYSDRITGAIGGVCDIVYNITLDIKHDSTINTVVTACDTFTWHGNTYNASAVDTYNYVNADGCPSVENLRLTINYNSSSSYATTQCDSYTWGDSAYTATGIYLYHYNTSAGCPSVDTLRLTINHNSNIGRIDTVCNEFSWVDSAKSLNRTFTASGLYYHNYTSDEGCPSVDTLNLTVYYDSNRAFTQTVCDTFTWTNNDSIKGYNVSGTYYNSYLTAEKCLSVDTLYLTVNYNSDTTIVDTACNEYAWVDEYRNIDTVYTTSVTHDIFSIINDAGCISQYDLTLQVNYSTSAANHLTGVSAVCDSYIWAMQDGTYDTVTTSGTYYDTYTTANGCPSVDTLYIDIKYSTSHDTTFRFVCDSLVWDGNVYKNAGAYTFTYSSIKNAVFCDSVERITLLGINNSTHNVTTDTACENYIWHGRSYATVGMVTDTFSYENEDGCYSIDTLHLTIMSYASIAPDVDSAFGSYTWSSNGEVYTHSGSYSYIDAASCQIDSLILKIKFNVVAVAANSSFDTAIHVSNTTPAEYDTVTIYVNRIRGRGKQFASWNDGNTDNPRVMVVTSDINLVATFTDVYHTVVAESANDTFGSVTGSGSYPYASSARLVATPEPGYHFLRWNDYNASNPRYVSIADTDYHFIAYFAPNSFIITAVSADPATGSVFPGSDTITTGQGVTLTANANSGFHFSRWHDGNTSNPRTVYPTSDTVYTAYFDMNTRALYDTVCKKWNNIVMRYGGDTVVRDTNSARTLATVHYVHFKRYAEIDLPVDACGVLPYSYTTSRATHVVNQAVSNFADTITYTSTSRCDSIKHYTLTVKSPTTATWDTTVCDKLKIGDTTFTTTGVYTVTTTNVYGCDSIITLQLHVDTHRDTTYLAGIGCDSVVWKGFTYTETDTVINYRPAVAGNVCPIVEHALVFVVHSSRDTVSASLCAGTPFRFVTTKRAWQDTMYEERRGQNPATGCDSIYTISLSVYPLQSVHDTQTACLSYRGSNGIVYPNSGEYRFRYYDIHNCDSTVTLHLTIENEPVREVPVKACEQYVWPLNNRTYTASSIDTVHVPSTATACDSVIKMRLSIYQKPTAELSGDVCLGQSFVGNGFTIAADSIRTLGNFVFSRTRGYDVATTCDSLYNITIVVHGSDRTEANDTACLSHTWNGNTYATSGTYSYRTRNRYGCDSISILHLVINHERYGTVDTIACGVFEWDGIDYTNDSIMTLTLVASNGCDSILTVRYSVKSTYRDTVPVGPRCDSLTFMGETYRDNFDFIHNYPTVYGCDSLVLYQIRVNHTTVISEHDTIYKGESLYFHGHRYAIAGTWPVRVAGDEITCDSIYMLYLVVLDPEGISEAGNVSNLSLYPNPTTGVLHIGNGEATHVDVLDIVGRLVASYDNTNTIDLSKLPAGSYTLRITMPDGVAVRKVVKR